MLMRETDVDERLDLLENVEDGDVFMYDGSVNSHRFHNKTVAKIVQNKEMTHALIIFIAEADLPELAIEKGDYCHFTGGKLTAITRSL